MIGRWGLEGMRSFAQERNAKKSGVSFEELEPFDDKSNRLQAS